MGKHLAPEATGTAAVALAVNRALARAKGKHGRRRAEPGPITPTALLGLDDVDLSRLDRMDGLDSRLVEVRAELDRPINTTAVAS